MPLRVQSSDELSLKVTIDAGRENHTCTEKVSTVDRKERLEICSSIRNSGSVTLKLIKVCNSPFPGQDIQPELNRPLLIVDCCFLCPVSCPAGLSCYRIYLVAGTGKRATRY